MPSISTTRPYGSSSCRRSISFSRISSAAMKWSGESVTCSSGKIRGCSGRCFAITSGSLSSVGRARRGDRHHLGELGFRREVLDERQQPLLGVRAVDLVDQQDDRQADALQFVEHALVLVGPAQRLDHEQVHVDVRQRRDRRAVHVAVHRARLLRVDARQVDEHDLHARLVQHAQDARARGLRLRAHDADLLPDQRVQQRGLAHVRPSGQRGKAAADRGLVAGGRNRSLLRQSPCSPACGRGPRARVARLPVRRAVGSSRGPSRAAQGAGTSQLATNHCSWGSPPTSSSAYSGNASPRDCSSSCRRVLGSLSASAEGNSRRRAPSSLSMTSRAASMPPSR